MSNPVERVNQETNAVMESTKRALREASDPIEFLLERVRVHAEAMFIHKENWQEALKSRDEAMADARAEQALRRVVEAELEDIKSRSLDD